MEFYCDKLRKIRKQKKISLINLAAQLDVNRATLWTWESGRIQPSVKMVRYLAKALNISVTQISNLQPEVPVSECIDISQVNSLLYSFGNTNAKERREHQVYFLEGLQRQFDELNQVSIVNSVFINSIQLICYVKDLSLKYVLANDAFLKNLSIDKDYKVLGKEDKDFFSEKEAKQNAKQDEQVIFTGISINREDFIPGSKKKHWGIISKVPIFDFFGKITGMLAYITDITERKKAEDLANTLIKIIGIRDEIIWVCKNAKEKPNWGIMFEQFLYANDARIRKEFFDNNNTLSSSEIFEKIVQMITKKDKCLNLKILKEKGFDVGHFDIKHPSENKVYKIKCNAYYDAKSELYVYIAGENTERIKTEKIIENLRKYGVNEEIIKKATAE